MIFDTVTRSWEITKLSFGVIRQDKELLLFPLLGGIASILFVAAMLVPSVVIQLLDEAGGGFVYGPVEWAATFALYFGLAFIATFFNVCVVYTSKVRFEGGDATFLESLKFAISRVHLIVLWSALSASVGLVLRGVESAARRAGGVAGFVLDLLGGMLGLIWSVVTLFVVPAMVYEDLGPIDAIKRSVEVLKRTWGESLVRHYGLGLIQFVATLPGALLIFGAFMGPQVLILPLLALGGLWILVVSLVFSVAHSVFNTALFAYARDGVVPSGYDETTLMGAFRPRGHRATFG